MPDRDLRDLVLRHRKDVRYRIVGDEAVVVRQDAAEVLAVNDVGARVLELVDARTSVGAVIDALRVEYDVDGDALTRDVEGFVTAMRDAGVLEPVEPLS